MDWGREEEQRLEDIIIHGVEGIMEIMEGMVDPQVFTSILKCE